MNSVDFAKFSAAVSCCFNQTLPSNIRQEALQYLDLIKSSDDGWKFCLMFYLSNNQDLHEAKFFSLQVIEEVLRNKYNQIHNDDRVFLKISLTKFFAEEIPKRTRDPSYIRNKFAHILVLLFIQEFLTTWTSFFTDLSFSLSSLPHVDMFLRICITIDQEIVSRLISKTDQQATISTAIKDKMRDVAINNFVEIWYNILLTYHQTSVDIVNMCLRVISLYVDWIEINLVVSNKFMTAFFNFLQREEYVDAACECVNEIVLKGMSAEKKMSLIQAINFSQVLKVVESREDGYTEGILKLVNSIGVTLAECWIEMDKDEKKQEQEKCYQMINSVMPFFFKLYVNNDENISSHVVDFSNALISIFKASKKKGDLNLEKKSAVQNLLSAIVIKMKYLDPSNVDSSDPEFEEQKKRLKVQFESVSSIDEDMMIEYVSGAFTLTMNNLDKCHYSDASLSLRLLFLYGDATKGQIKFGKVGKPLEVCLTQMMKIMMERNVSSFPHPSVQSEYFENIVRYSKFFESFPEYLQAALESFLDWRGLHHNDSSMRNRVMYLFFRFVKSLRVKLLPHLEIILSSLQDLLSLPDANLTIIRPRRRRLSQNSICNESQEVFNDQLYLFETVGLLISMEQISDEKKIQYLSAAVTPLLAKIDEIMNKQLYKHDTEDNPIYCTILHHAITAIATISKGFPTNTGKSCCWQPIFKNCLERTLYVLTTVPNSQLVKDATRFSFQRLVGCLGQEILPYLPSSVSLLLPNSQVRDLIDFIPLISQLTFRFKDTIFPILNQLIGDILKPIFAILQENYTNLSNQEEEINSYETLQVNELKKAYISMLLAIFMSGLSAVFTSSENIGFVNAIFLSLIQFIKNDDGQIQKPAIGLLTKITDTWATRSSDRQPLAGFNHFALQEILPLSFEVIMKPSFNASDGQSIVILGEIVNIQKTIFNKLDAEIMEYLKVYLPKAGFNSILSQEYIQSLQESDPKVLKKFLTGLAKQKSVS